MKVDRVVGWLLRALLPPRCLLCGDAGDDGRDLCARCEAAMPVNRNGCPRCALPLEQAAICGRCLKREPAFDEAWAPFVYSHPLDIVESRFKFGGDLAAGHVLSQLMRRRAGVDQPAMPDLIVPVPLHASRLRQRGYNQSLELARPLAKALRIPVDHGRLLRVRDTTAQTGLDAGARRRNVGNAFAVATGARWPDHVVIVDDVMTTGSTLDACARALRRVGVQRIGVWALARAPARR